MRVDVHEHLGVVDVDIEQGLLRAKVESNNTAGPAFCPIGSDVHRSHVVSSSVGDPSTDSDERLLTAPVTALDSPVKRGLSYAGGELTPRGICTTRGSSVEDGVHARLVPGSLKSSEVSAVSTSSVGCVLLPPKLPRIEHAVRSAFLPASCDVARVLTAATRIPSRLDSPDRSL